MERDPEWGVKLPRLFKVRRKDEAACGEYRTKRVILKLYDAMGEAIQVGIPYRTRLDPLRRVRALRIQRESRCHRTTRSSSFTS